MLFYAIVNYVNLKIKMLEKILFTTSALLASVMSVAIISSNLHAQDIAEIFTKNSARHSKSVASDDKILTIDNLHHHNHTNRFTIDSMKQMSDQRSLKKYIAFNEKHSVMLLD